MLEIAVAIAICSAILGAWFVLRISMAELILALFVFCAGAAGVYWFCMGRRVSAIVEGVGIFVLLVIFLGSIRVGLEKLSDMLARLRSESGKQHYPSLPR